MNALDELCRLFGIADDYYDIWGNRREVSRESRLALLSAMGVPVGAGDDLEAVLADCRERTWARMLPPVRVVRENTPWDVSLTVAAATGKGRWRLVLENGEEREGRFDLAALEPLERDGAGRVRLRLSLPPVAETGYHRLEVESSARKTEMPLIVSPPACYTPPALEEGGRVWGPALQVYALRSRRNWGMGDFTDLEHAVAWFAAQGAGIVGLNPLHALFPGNPRHASPYSPSSRLFLNVYYLDVEAVPDFPECESARRMVGEGDFQARLAALREAELVDYPAVAGLKLRVLEQLYAHFRERHLERKSARGKAFRAFQNAHRDTLFRHALFEALQEHIHRQNPDAWGWLAWPEPYRDPDSGEVEAFIQAHRERIEFFQYLQWQAELQLEAVGRRSQETGVRVGLYNDLAVSVDRGGAEVWGHQNVYALDVSVGCPPDDFNLQGQDWGLPPFIPERLRESAYAPFVATLRACMRHAGALRLDHVMGLMRLFWIPAGGKAADGAYVHYPFEEMLGVLALESRRNRCLIIGEDLGTVPDEVRNALGPMGVLSYRLFYFEREWDGNFKIPGNFEPRALVAASTHDLPTLRGFWEQADVALRDRLGLFPSPEMRERVVEGRRQDRWRLLAALAREGLLPPGADLNPDAWPHLTPELVNAILTYVARTPAKVMTLQLEDALGQMEQVNVPGTVDEYPNWRRKLPVALEDWNASGLPAVAAQLRAVRP